MKAKILDERSEGEATCYLCRVSLDVYVGALPDDYQTYDIQREIVRNVYLDHLVDTILARHHIPSITLVVPDGCHTTRHDYLVVRNFRILDGLQRTYRLKAIFATDAYRRKLGLDEDYLSWNKFKFSRRFSAELRGLNSTAEVLRSLLQAQKDIGDIKIQEALRDNPQWFEIWTGLTPEEEVQKMLTLNAGHKPVKTRHQLELLFLNLLPILKSGHGDRFKLVREKEISSTAFSKAREPGTFHFAHIITSLLSLIEGVPIAPSTDLIQSIQADDLSLDEREEFSNVRFLKGFVSFVVALDQTLSDRYGEVGTLWMGREVSLAGLFGALGAYARESQTPPLEVAASFQRFVNSHPAALNLKQFEDQRNSVDLSKVNIGVVNRSAVFSAITELLKERSDKPLDWKKHFRQEAQ